MKFAYADPPYFGCGKLYKRQFLIRESLKLYRKGWKIIWTKGTSSIEYRRLFNEQLRVNGRVAEIDKLLKEHPND